MFGLVFCSGVLGGVWVAALVVHDGLGCGIEVAAMVLSDGSGFSDPEGLEGGVMVVPFLVVCMLELPFSWYNQKWVVVIGLLIGGLTV